MEKEEKKQYIEKKFPTWRVKMESERKGGEQLGMHFL